MVNDNNVKLVSFSKTLAEKYSVREAAVLQHLAFYVTKDKLYSGLIAENRRWVYHTEQQLLTALPFFKNVKGIINKLVTKGVLLKKHFSKRNNISYYAFADKEVQIEAIQNKYYFDAGVAEKFNQCGENVAIVYHWFVKVSEKRNKYLTDNKWIQASPRSIAMDLTFISHMTIWRSMQELVNAGYLEAQKNAFWQEFRVLKNAQIVATNATEKSDQKDGSYLGVFVTANEQKEGCNKYTEGCNKYAPSVTNSTNPIYIKSINSSVLIKDPEVKSPAALEDQVSGTGSLKGQGLLLIPENEQAKLSENEDNYASRNITIPANPILENETDECLRVMSTIKLISETPLRKKYQTKIDSCQPLTSIFYNLLSFDLEQTEYVKNYPIGFFSKYCGKIDFIDQPFNFELKTFKNAYTDLCAKVILNCVRSFNEHGLTYMLNHDDVLAACNFIARYPEVDFCTLTCIFEFVCGLHKSFHDVYPEQPENNDYFLSIEYPNIKLGLRAHHCTTLVYFFNNFSYFLTKMQQLAPFPEIMALKPKRYNQMLCLKNTVDDQILNELHIYFQNIANILGPVALRLELCDSWRKRIISAGIAQPELLANLNACELETWCLTEADINQPLTVNFYFWACTTIAKINPSLFPTVTIDAL